MIFWSILAPCSLWLCRQGSAIVSSVQPTSRASGRGANSKVGEGSVQGAQLLRSAVAHAGRGRLALDGLMSGHLGSRGWVEPGEDEPRHARDHDHEPEG